MRIDKPSPEAISMYTIYFNPSDYPEKYVTRKWLIIGGFGGPVPTKIRYITNTLPEARKHVPRHVNYPPLKGGAC